MTNFELVEVTVKAKSPDKNDQYWVLADDPLTHRYVGLILSQNGFKQFLYCVLEINEAYLKYLSGNKSISKWQFLCNKFSNDLGIQYPRKYPCLLQAWWHFEGGMLELQYLPMSSLKPN